MLQGVHEIFARALGTSLSTFLQSEIQADLAQISVVPAGEFQKTLRAPACLIRLRLVPRDECIVVQLSPPVVFGLLEKLLGGSGSGEIQSRALTEIEWSLLEEVVRVIVRVLGEAWQVFHEVEFKVESLENDPAMLPAQDAAKPLVWNPACRRVRRRNRRDCHRRSAGVFRFRGAAGYREGRPSNRPSGGRCSAQSQSAGGCVG